MIKELKKLKKYFSFWYILGVITLTFISFLIVDTQHKEKITIAVGTETGAYYEHAKMYQKIFREKYNIELIFHKFNGSQDIQRELLNDNVDFAMAQSSTEIYDKNNELFILANIAYEPVWIFYKDRNISSFQDLKDRRNNIDKKLSGTNIVAKLLLKQIDAPLTQSEYKTADAIKLFQKGQLDTLFLTFGIKAKILDKMINLKDIQILDFKEAYAYKNFFLKESEISNYDFNRTHYFEVIELKKHSLSLKNKIPSKDITLLTTQTMILTKNSSNAMSRLMLKVMEEVHSKASILNSEHHFPNCSMIKLKQHPASVDYFNEKEHRYERYNLFNSFWLAQSLKKVEDFILLFIIPLGLIGFFIEVIYPMTKLITRREINSWYKKVNESDTDIELLTFDELKRRRDKMEALLVEIQNRDDIDPVHLEAYYSLQNQITNILEELEKRIKLDEPKQIYVEIPS